MAKALKIAAIALLLVVLGAYAVWQKMQLLSVFALLALLGVVFGSESQRLFNLLLEILAALRQARVGQVEFKIGKDADKLEIWTQTLLANMSGEDVSLLLAIALSSPERFPAIDGIKDRLRSLRAHGMIRHDHEWMSKSTEVWLTELGERLARALLGEADSGGASSKEDTQE